MGVSLTANMTYRRRWRRRRFLFSVLRVQIPTSICAGMRGGLFIQRVAEIVAIGNSVAEATLAA
jgi:hypothetical protein